MATLASQESSMATQTANPPAIPRQPPEGPNPPQPRPAPLLPDAAQPPAQAHRGHAGQWSRNRQQGLIYKAGCTRWKSIWSIWITRAFWVKTCIATFHRQHFDQVRTHRYLEYTEFKRKIIEIFKNAQTWLSTKLWHCGQSINKMKRPQSNS